MDIKDVLKKQGIQPRDLGHVGAEEATEVMHEPASVDDRIVNEEKPAEERSKKTVKKEGIVSVNGEDVDKTEVEIEKDRAA
jgi:hypothetical protein